MHTDSTTSHEDDPAAIAAIDAYDWRHGLWPTGLLALGVVCIALNGAVRSLEAFVAAKALHLVIDGHTWAVYPTHTFYWLSDYRISGLHITAECTSALLIGPLLIIGAALMIGNRFPRRTIVSAVAIVSVMIFTVNQLRLIVIGWATERWGDDGFDWSHVIAGTVVTVVGVVAALGVFALILVRSRSARPVA